MNWNKNNNDNNPWGSGGNNNNPWGGGGSNNNMDFEESIKKNEAYIMRETLTEELVFVDQLTEGVNVEFDTIKSKILIHKM